MDDLQKKLAIWFEDNKRTLPWRTDPSSYHVWLSEVILQQTRVNQGFDYFNRFVEQWPTLNDLANASEEEVLKMWQGLGYYSRARNLHQCAKEVVEKHGGIFPADFEKLKQLKGIGNYTAAAIASIAYGLPHAVVDGNVYRVLSRLYDIDTPINKTNGIKQFANLAEILLDKKHPGRHNQAMMELGALLCTPKNPDCLHCPIQDHCLALAHHTVDQRPKKEHRNHIRTRYLNYLFIITENHQICLHKRTEKDIWKNLYDFPCVETEKPMDTETLIKTTFFKKIIPNDEFIILNVSPPHIHKLTHQTLIATFTQIKIKGFFSIIQTKDILLTPENDLGTFPVPKLIENYLYQNYKPQTNNEL